MANQRERNRAAEAHLIRHTVYLPRGAYPEGDKQIPLNTKTNTWGFLFLQLLFKLVIVAVEDGVVVVFVYKGRRRLVYRVLLWKSRLGVRVWAVMVFLSSMLWRRSSRLWHLRGLDILNRREELVSKSSFFFSLSRGEVHSEEVHEVVLISQCSISILAISTF
jgi:hypothetical protein